MNFILLPQRNQSLHNVVMRKYTDVGSWEWLGAHGCDGCRTATRYDLNELTLPNDITAAHWGVCVCQGREGR